MHHTAGHGANDLHILIVDADAAAREATAGLIRRVAPDASFALEATPADGLATLETHRPQLLIIDPPLYGIAGRTLILRVKDTALPAQVIVLIPRVTTTIRRSMHDLPVDLFLEKSTASRLLIEYLRTLIEASSRVATLTPLHAVRRSPNGNRP